MTLTDQQAVAEEASTSSAKGRWVIRMTLVLAAVAAVGLVALLGWAWNYQPLTSGTMTGVFGGSGAEVREITNSFGTEYRVVRAERGSTVKVIMSLDFDGDGPAGVTVNSVGSPVPITGGDMVGFADSFETSSRLMEPPPVDHQTEDLATGPVDLEPGDVLQVTITLTLPMCSRDWTRGGLTSFGDVVPVDYSAFGVSHTTDIPLGYALTFGHTPNCPAR